MIDDDFLLDISDSRPCWLHLESAASELAAQAAVDQWTALMMAENWPAFEFEARGRHVFGRFVGTLAYLNRKRDECSRKRKAVYGEQTGRVNLQPHPESNLADRIVKALAIKPQTTVQIAGRLGCCKSTVAGCLRRRLFHRIERVGTSRYGNAVWGLRKLVEA